MRQPDIRTIIEAFGQRVKLQATRPNIHGYKPHPKQLAFHTNPCRGRLLAGGNRVGKTVGGCTEDVWWLLGIHPYRQDANYKAHNGGCQGRIIGVDFVNAIEKTLLPMVARWIPPSALINGSWTDSYTKQTRTLTLANKSSVDFMSLDQDLESFASVSRDFVHYDEEPDHAVFVENSTRLIDSGGSWWITFTPIKGMLWMFDELYTKGKNDPTANIGVIEAEMTENPYLSRVEIDSYISSLNEDEKQARVKGQFVRRGGLVFKNFDPSIHVIDSMVPPLDHEWYTSVDHGYNNPTAWLWHAVSPDGVVITFSEHYERERTVEYHSQVVLARDLGFGRPPDVRVGDPALAQRNGVTGTSIFQEYADNGIVIVPGNNDVIPGINRMNTYLSKKRPRWFITRNCHNLIWEMQRLRWKTWQTTKALDENNPYDTIHKKDDHACDSARYFFTFVPDLTPMVASENVERANLLNAQSYAPVAGQFDELLAMSKPKVNTEYSGVDEVTGYF